MRLMVGMVMASAVCLLFTGCGSQGGGSSTATVTVQADRPPTKAEFIEQVDAICAQRNPEVQALGERASNVADAADSSSDLGEVADIYREASSIVETGDEELRALTPPAADTAIYNAYLRSFESQLAQVEALADAVDAADTEKMEEVAEELETTDAASDGIAKGYGFKVCGAD